MNDRMKYFFRYMAEKFFVDWGVAFKQIMRPKNWFYISIFLSLYLSIIRSRFGFIGPILVIVTYFIYEYKRGDWIHKMREEK